MSTQTPVTSTTSSGATGSAATGSSVVPRLVLAWTVVGVPLAYGIYETAKKASALFTG